jgi:hypothetical protein
VGSRRSRTELRAAFAVRMADVYGTEVPAYRTFLATEREMVTDSLGHATYAAGDVRAARPGMTPAERVDGPGTP